jgi:asparagine synthase (glutamine-hydrolysing)
MALSFPYEINYESSRARNADEIDPLFSQPVIEACLRTPTYVLTAEGWDRATARYAFAGEVPPEIIRRRSKCVPEEYGKRVIAHNIAFIRELMMDGALAKQGMIDRDKLEIALSGCGVNGSGSADLLKFVSTEAWLRTQPQPRRKIAA